MLEMSQSFTFGRCGPLRGTGGRPVLRGPHFENECSKTHTRTHTHTYTHMQVVVMKTEGVGVRCHLLHTGPRLPIRYICTSSLNKDRSSSIFLVPVSCQIHPSPRHTHTRTRTHHSGCIGSKSISI